MSDARPVGAVVLAAGASRRFGSPKQLAMVDGRTLLEHAIDGALRAGLAPIAVVVPIWLAETAGADDDRLRWVRNPFPERGMSVSLRLGLAALGNDVGAAVILLGDQPRLGEERIAAILAERGPRPIVAAIADGVGAPPVLIERSHFHLADELGGDIGLRQLIRSHADLVRHVPVASHPLDVDTPDDLARMAGP